MNDIYLTAKTDAGLTPEEIKAALLKSLEGRDLKKVLILPPDFTRTEAPVVARLPSVVLTREPTEISGGLAAFRGYTKHLHR